MLGGIHLHVSLQLSLKVTHPIVAVTESARIHGRVTGREAVGLEEKAPQSQLMRSVAGETPLYEVPTYRYLASWRSGLATTSTRSRTGEESIRSFVFNVEWIYCENAMCPSN